MKRASRLRRIEMAFWAMGIALCGVALGATFDRWNYQVRQERVLFSATQSVPTPERIELPPLRAAPPVPAGHGEQYGPPAPQITRENTVEKKLEKPREIEAAPRQAAEERASSRRPEAF